MPAYFNNITILNTWGDFAPYGEGALPAYQITASALESVSGNAALTLPAVQITATGSWIPWAANTLPAYQIEAVTSYLPYGAGTLPAYQCAGQTVTPLQVALTLPAFTGEGLAGAQAGNTLPAYTGDATGTPRGGIAILALPQWALTAAGSQGPNGRATLTLPTLAVEIVIGAVGTPTLPALTLTASGHPGVVARAALTLPARALTVWIGAQAASDLPLPTLQASGFAGLRGDAANTLPLRTIQATAQQQLLGTVGLLTLPHWTSQATALVGTVGTLARPFPAFRLAATGVVGPAAWAALILPSPKVQATGSFAPAATAALLLPAWVGEGATPISQYYALALALEELGLSEYTNFAFNSLAWFNGVPLAAGETGIYELLGATDAGAAIAATVRMGTTDFGTSHLKRVPACYLGYRSAGELKVILLADEAQQQTVTVAAGAAEARTHRVKLGRGIKGRYFTVEIQNVNGADFDLDTVELQAEPLSRRVP